MLVFFLSLLFFSFDFFLKKIIELKFDFNTYYSLLGDIVRLRVVHNKGAAFGLFQGRVPFLIAVGFLFLVIFIFWVSKARHSLGQKLCLGMILGGALSNLYDRIFLGYVIDYIDLGWWPVFNLSDTFITLGCIFLILPQFIKDGREKVCRRKKT